MHQVFNGGAAHAALNIPTMKAHLIDPVKHLLSIAEKLGCVMVQLAEKKIKSIGLDVCGVPENANLSPVTTCFLKGFLSRISMGTPAACPISAHMPDPCHRPCPRKCHTMPQECHTILQECHTIPEKCHATRFWCFSGFSCSTQGV